jgi:NDP-sugar pyrophosphorylase family protein
LHPRAFKDFTAQSFHLPEVYHSMEQKGRLYGLPLKGAWCDMGTLRTLRRLEAYLQP